jgi:hypothetical protein
LLLKEEDIIIDWTNGRQFKDTNSPSMQIQKIRQQFCDCFAVVVLDYLDVFEETSAVNVSSHLVRDLLIGYQKSKKGGLTENIYSPTTFQNS